MQQDEHDEIIPTC